MKRIITNKEKEMNAIKAGFLSLTALASVACAYAEEEAKPQVEEEKGLPISVEVSVDVLSEYMWRGQICNDNPVWQPSVTLGYDMGDYGSIGANIWSKFDLTHKRNTTRMSGGLQEIDYTLFYDISLAGFDFEFGHVWYTFPDHGNKSKDRYCGTGSDLYASVSYANDYLTPTVAVYWDYNDNQDNDPKYMYFTFGVEHEFAITDDFALTPNASLGVGNSTFTRAWCWDGDEAEGKKPGVEMVDSTIGLSASYAICENLSVGAQVNYTWLPSKTMRHANYMSDDKDQIVWGGVNMTLSF